MSVFKSKSADIIILVSVGLLYNQPLIYGVALILPLLPLQRPIISTIVTIITLLPKAISGSVVLAILSLLVVFIHVFWHGLPWRQHYPSKPDSSLSSKYLIFIYLLAFSFLTVSSGKYSHYTALALMDFLLFLYSLNSSPSRRLNFWIKTISYLTVVWGILATLAKENFENRTIFKWIRQQSPTEWWYYLGLSLSSWIGFILAYQIDLEMSPGYKQYYQNKQKSVSDIKNFSAQYSLSDDGYEMIEMREISAMRNSQQYIFDRNDRNSISDHMSEGESMHSSRMNRLPTPLPFEVTLSNEQERKKRGKARVQVKIDKPKRQRQENNQKHEQKNESSTLQHHDWSSEHEGQGEVTNLFLLIPFTKYSPIFLQIPIYFYLIWLQTGRTPMCVFYTMFFSICAITFYDSPDQSTLLMKFLLRICMILIVNKNFNIAINITQVLRSVWLRSSFVFVLLVLFWFSLLKANIFHICFVLIVLLFITKNNPNVNSQEPSFRHRNWKYLILLFNIFLVLRFLWLMLIKDFNVQFSEMTNNILSVIGISYEYRSNETLNENASSFDNFNVIPLIVSGVLTIQYWTYTSRIYDFQSKKDLLPFLPDIKNFIIKIVEILKIVYYKLIPWTSHAVVIIILISLEFSLIADLVLFWSLIILLVHMVQPNNVSAYKSMYRMWNIFLKLVSIQIILRYVFEFLKFPIIIKHVSKLPLINTLIENQELLGLAIRQSKNGIFMNILNKFQLMMILDFSIIAISFLMLEYYEIMIKYYQCKQPTTSQSHQEIGQQEQELTQILLDRQPRQSKDENLAPKVSEEEMSPRDAIHIYEKYIDFKLTEWLQNFNELMVRFSHLFLKLYYPVIGLYSCIFFSYSTLTYFLIVIYYYLKLNLKFYQVFISNQVQTRITKLFTLWRIKNGIKVNPDTPAISPNDLIAPNNAPNQHSDIELQHISSTGYVSQQGAQQMDLQSQIKKLRRQVKLENPSILFDHFIQLHIKLRYWLLILTTGYILITFTSRVLVSPEIKNILEEQTIEWWRYFLFICGTSVESQIHINIYLFIIVLTIIEIKCCSLISKIGRPMFNDNHRMQTQENPIQTQQNSPVKQAQSDGSGFSEELFKNQTLNFRENKENNKFIDIEISLRLGINKMMERFFVILLVLVSLLENQNPFSIIYLVCAWFLNFMGGRSIQALSWTLSFLVILQYSLVISDTSNKFMKVKQHFPDKYVENSWLIRLFRVTDDDWKLYLTFGDNFSEISVLCLSVLILMTYQICFYLEEYNWVKILNKMYFKVHISDITRKIYEHFSSIYEYALVYSPLCITIICLGLYLMDFTATNMFLSILSILFLFKSFLLQDYTNSRPFWKSYFRILQLLIVIFMVVFCVLSTPMYEKYCNKFFCSEEDEDLHTKITKTILLFILQIGIDLIQSHHYRNAMKTLESALTSTSSLYKIAISYVQNDKKIKRQFTSLSRKQEIKNNLISIKNFIEGYQKDQSTRYDTKKIKEETSQSWLDSLLQLLPSLIDAEIVKTPEETKSFIKSENDTFIKWLQKKGPMTEEQIRTIHDRYADEFESCKGITEMKEKIYSIIGKPKASYRSQHLMLQSGIQANPRQTLTRQEKYNPNSMSSDHLSARGYKSFGVNIGIGEPTRRTSAFRGSFINPMDDQLSQLQILQSGLKRVGEGNINIINEELQTDTRLQLQRRSTRRTVVEHLRDRNQDQKTRLLYLYILESVLSNWHYLTYLLMIIEFTYNMGVLTLPFPILTFALGIIHSYQAPKTIWKLSFLALLLPIFFKYSLSIELFTPGKTLQIVLIGTNSSSIFIEYLLMFFIIVQCLILKVVGLYDESTADVECMNLAIIRNIINLKEKNTFSSQQLNEQNQQRNNVLFTLLEHSKQSSSSFFQYLFSLYECKNGYDYSTMMVSVQLAILLFIFTFYDRMAISEDLNFYNLIQYNQFRTGMVVMAFIQLGFILIDRILTVLEFSYKKWDVSLIIKYAMLIVALVYVHAAVLCFFPLNSGYFGNNYYITVFYILHLFYFLISSLQIKVGVNKESRGFIDRYTWYNGFIYNFYRAIPFLFEFKVFSDWTFTNTSLRLFDWIKYEQILGYLYVAKCNSLFMKGKILGSKIQWWKKLMMGFPLLLAIILLLFGPLILFSSLNPLSSLNEVTGGYLELSLKINKTNEYPFYKNTHMIDIQYLVNETDPKIKEIIKTQELDQRSIQVVNLEPYSDQYWEISQGSYDKLIQEPQNSTYELQLRVRFQRNLTGTTPIYVLKNFTIPRERVRELKQTLQGNNSFKISDFVPTFMRLDNNNGIHSLTPDYSDIQFHAQESRTHQKKYWVISKGISFKIASDKYSKAIFGYSVMSFYISIILVVANYFRSLFQGGATTIIMSDIPYADSLLLICDGIHQARLRNDIKDEQMLFFLLIDVFRSPDLMKASTGNYLNARLQTLSNQAVPEIQDEPQIIEEEDFQKDDPNEQKKRKMNKKYS